MVGREGEGEERGITISTHNVARVEGARGRQYNTEKTSSDSIASYCADGQ